MRVVVTRIEPDGTMQRRVVDTAQRDDGLRWEDLAARALASSPACRPVRVLPSTTSAWMITVSRVGEYDLGGPLRDLVTVMLAVGDEV
jgi:hypothetical protein